MILFFLFLDSLFTPSEPGLEAFPQTSITNCFDIYAFGDKALSNALLTNSETVFCIGDPFWPNDPPSLRPVLPVPRFLNAPSGK